MIHVIQGFQLSTREAVDNRLVLSKAEMVSTDDNRMPEKYFAVCKDDGYLYSYDKSRTPNIETGRFQQYTGNKIESISVNGTPIPISNRNVDLPLATAEKYGLVIPGNGLVAVNGILTLDFNSLDDHIIPFEKIDFQNVIIVADNI